MEDPAVSQRHLLIVDDETTVLKALAWQFRDRYVVHACLDAEAAFDALARAPVQVVISDERMPQMSGTEFLARVRAEHPETIRMILTGHAEVHEVIAGINACGLFRYLTKPWNRVELDMAVEEAFQKHELIASNRKLLADLSEAKEAAEAASRTKSAFLSCMSHEMRTPLNAILGFAQLLGGHGALGGEQVRHVEAIRRSGEQLLGLIDDVIELSKVEGGRSVPTQVRFDVHRLLDDLRVTFSLPCARKGLGLSVEWGTQLPRWIRADQGKLRHVLVNLVGNAVKFTEQGSVTVRAVLRDEDLLVLEIEDSGPGIPPKGLAALFRPFEQVGRAVGTGAGLGLALARELCRVMGGTLEVDSRVHRGSTFRILVPVAVDGAGPASGGSGVIEAVPAQEPPPPRGRLDKHVRRRIRSLPLAVRESLRDSVVLADVEVLKARIDAVVALDDEVGATMRELVEAFDYGQLLALLE